MLTYFIEALRPVLAAGVLVLVTCSTSLAAPIADPYFDAPIIKMFWGSKQPSYQSDMDSVTPGSPHGAALHLFYLNAAFEDAGVSLDKSFRNWIEVYTSEGQETLYPEVVSFGKTVGFDQLMGYLIEPGGQHQLAMYSTDILSKRTQALLDMHLGSQ